jgi:uncharacterized metal-binding protein
METIDQCCSRCEERTTTGVDNLCLSCADERRALAKSLSRVLDKLSVACLKAAEGDEDAKRLLEDYTDGYWRALVVGRGKLEWF